MERHKASFPTQPGEITRCGIDGDLPCWDCRVPSGSRVHAGPIQDLRIKGGTNSVARSTIELSVISTSALASRPKLRIKIAREGLE